MCIPAPRYSLDDEEVIETNELRSDAGQQAEHVAAVSSRRSSRCSSRGFNPSCSSRGTPILTHYYSSILNDTLH